MSMDKDGHLSITIIQYYHTMLLCCHCHVYASNGLGVNKTHTHTHPGYNT